MEDKLVTCKYYGGKTGEFVVLPPDGAGLPEILDKLSDVGAGLENSENRKAVKSFVEGFKPLIEAINGKTPECE